MAASRPVLVIDDDDSIRELVQMALRDEGYDVLTAQHGDAALSLLGHEQPGLILLDMRMPVMDGWAFTHAYRQLQGPHAPIIVCTAARDAMNSASQVHADGYLAKPFEVEALRTCVARYAATGRGRRI